MLLTSYHFFQIKYKSSIYNIGSSSEKVVWSESGMKSAQIKHRLQAKTALKTCGWIWETAGDGLFHWREALIWIMNSYFSLKHLNDGFYQLFGLSFWRHPFTADDPLVSKWWNAKFIQIWW